VRQECFGQANTARTRLAQHPVIQQVARRTLCLAPGSRIFNSHAPAVLMVPLKSSNVLKTCGHRFDLMARV
jgi:hypothetical protein